MDEQAGLVEALNRRLVRMALDVHDGPMQDLVAAGYALSALRQRLGGDADGEAAAVEAALAGIQSRLVAVEQGLRSVIFALERSVEGPSLREAVAAVVAVVEADTGARIRVTVDGDVQAVTDSQRIALCQVVRESLTNAVRHGRPRGIVVDLAASEELFELRVTDNGCGFDPALLARRRPDGRQVGIAGMRERLRLLGGTLTVQSRPGGPTTVTARLERWQPPATRPAQHRRQTANTLPSQTN